ncbi:Uncharacterised protein [Mycobacterium tuberculosis]|uniref:Uncharacterized protein n=1 Tax=Mycobacterium tuberculosis TaxID=1773 RepID=A0A916P966_MYCTX|nr:Uncharacterised protein [Mycobacterium tuberculosis]
MSSTKCRPDIRLPASRPCMSVNATMTVSTSPAATSRSNSVHANGGEPGPVTALPPTPWPLVNHL